MTTSRPCLGVPPLVHSDAMCNLWSSRGYPLSVALVATWSQVCNAFNRKLQEIGRPSQRDWHVCSPATGAGKTDSLKVYASLFPRFVKDAGLLAVCRLKVSADKMRDEINALAGRTVATSYHTDSDTPIDELRDFPVLIITHAAFERALELSTTKRSKWEEFTVFGVQGSRPLIVIDESIDVLDITRLSEDELSRTIGAIPSLARDRWPGAVAYMEDLLTALRQWRAVTRESGSESARVVRDEDAAAFERLFNVVPDFAGLREYMRTYRYVWGKRKNGAELSAFMGKDHARVVTEVDSLSRTFMVHHQRNRKASLSTARCIIPDDSQGVVVLDATAATNRLYDIMSKEEGLTVHRDAPPIGARSYRNVTVHIARVAATGKRSLTGRDDDGASIGKQEADRLLSWMAGTEEMQKHKEVFLACHLDNEIHFAGADLPFNLKTAHYGAIDGSNEFRTCTAAVIFGLPFRDPLDASLSFFALQGVQPGEWLSDETQRRFREFKDIRNELWLGWTITDLVQTVNRIAARVVINARGDCPPCDLFVMLPKGDRGDTIERRLMDQLPDASLPVAWNFTTARTEQKQKKRGKDYREALRVFIRNMREDEKVTASGLRQELGVSSTRWDALAAELKDSASELAAVMRARAVRYITERQGSRTVAYLTRTATLAA